MPSRRTRRVLNPRAVDLALLDAQRCRATLVQLLASAPIGGREYHAASAATAALDGLAEALTGDRTLWHRKAGECPVVQSRRGQPPLGTALAAASQRLGLTNADVEALEGARDGRPAPPLDFG